MDQFYRPSPANTFFHSNPDKPLPYNNTLNNNTLNNVHHGQNSQAFFKTAFNPLPTVLTQGYDPKDMFNNHNFVNKNDILHNNLNSILLNEEIREYSVMIDSKDRNYQVYPDPFCYEVKFGPLPKSRERINGKIVTYEDPAPIINDNFINVRYIKLETAILPLYNKTRIVNEICDNEPKQIYKVDITRSLPDLMYIVLSIGDYNDNNYRSTNDVLADSFAVIYYDGKISNTHYKGITSTGIKIFQQDQLGKIDKLKINFMDPYGRLLVCRHMDKNIKSNCICICDNPDGDDETNCFIHNLCHPLNPIFQHHLQFKIGVSEPRLNKLTFN